MQKGFVAANFFKTLIIITTLLDFLLANNLNPLSDEFIDEINESNTTWKAGRNFAKDVSLNYIGSPTGHLPAPKSYKLGLPVQNHTSTANSKIPDHFDSRDQWPKCPTIKEIGSQGDCSSGWAFGAVGAMSDRVCIQSKGKIHFQFSADDLVSCCSDEDCNGCNGGTSTAAWQYWINVGIVSGGSYGSEQGCRPYEIPPTTQNMNGLRSRCHDTPECKKTCRKGYKNTYKNDLRRGESAYNVASSVSNIQQEVMKYGPVEAGFFVYEDLFQYKSGVYQHVNGGPVGNHAVRLLGWGVENSVPYWLVANSWGTEWGEKGFFKILRGSNHCEIENDVVAGLAFKNV